MMVDIFYMPSSRFIIILSKFSMSYCFYHVIFSVLFRGYVNLIRSIDLHIRLGFNHIIIYHFIILIIELAMLKLFLTVLTVKNNPINKKNWLIIEANLRIIATTKQTLNNWINRPLNPVFDLKYCYTMMTSCYITYPAATFDDFQDNNIGSYNV